MPRLSVWLLRAALLHLGAGFTFGALILAHKGVPFAAGVWALLDAHVELLIVGWLIQLALGVGFWALPRFPGEQRYGRVRLGWLGFVLLNGGVILTAGAHWADATVLGFAGRLLSLSAVLAFAVLIWPRVKPLGGAADGRHAAN